MSLIDDLTGWKSKAVLIGGAIAAVGIVLLTAQILHWKSEAARVDGLVAANKALVEKQKKDDEIITGLNTKLAGLRKENKLLLGNLNAEIKKHPAAYSCPIPADGLRILNDAITGSAAKP